MGGVRVLGLCEWGGVWAASGGEWDGEDECGGVSYSCFWEGAILMLQHIYSFAGSDITDFVLSYFSIEHTIVGAAGGAEAPSNSEASAPTAN